MLESLKLNKDLQNQVDEFKSEKSKIVKLENEISKLEKKNFQLGLNTREVKE